MPELSDASSLIHAANVCAYIQSFESSRHLCITIATALSCQTQRAVQELLAEHIINADAPEYI